MTSSSPATRSRRWTSPRAILIHLATVAMVGICLAAARWQVHRAASGNILSYGYAVEWPLFAVAAVVMWWQLLHADVRPGRRDEPAVDPPPPWAAADDAELRAYNDELAALKSQGRRKTWRNPRGLP